MSKQQIAKLLAERGIIPTAQRLQIAEILLSKKQHLSADQVLSLAHRAGSRVSRPTTRG